MGRVRTGRRQGREGEGGDWRGRRGSLSGRGEGKKGARKHTGQSDGVCVAVINRCMERKRD